MSADLAHIDTWLFDLDDTLYGPEAGVMAAMEVRIEAWLSRERGVALAEVPALRRAMRDRHGSTLSALMAEGAVDVAAYLAAVHDLPLDAMDADLPLRTALERLPGRRLVHTNAPGHHAERILAKLGIDDLFEGVFHCEAAGFALKPQPQAYARMLEAFACEPATTCFFEDNERNLAPAAALGMTTVLVGPHAVASAADFVHHRTPRLTPFLESARVQERPA